MLTTKAQKMVASMTSAKVAKSYKAWKEAIYRVVALFGEDAIYWVDCDRFLKEDDEGVSALPYEEWQDGELIHIGIVVEHAYADEEFGDVGQLFTYSDAPILLW